MYEWQTLHSSPLSMLFARTADLDQFHALAESSGEYLALVELGGVDSKGDILVRFAQAFRFPSDYMANLNYDSLEEGLRDLGWVGKGGVVCVVNGSKNGWSEWYQELSMVTNILLEAIHCQMQAGRKLSVLYLD